MEIFGNTVVTTDWHIGLKSNSKSRQDIIVKAVDKMHEFIIKNDVKNMIFCGDLFHQRNSIDVSTLNVALNCTDKICQNCDMYMIVGNHDSYMKNTIDINSVNVFKNSSKMHIIDKFAELILNGKKIALIPWLSDVSSIKKQTYDMAFGHFDISTKYLIQSYVEHNSNNAVSEKTKTEISCMLGTNSANDLVGDFVDIVKKNGTVFAGHIHNRKEFKSKGRNFIFVGSPYQQTLGEIDSECGFYFLDCKSNIQFIKLEDLPIHIDLKMSEISKDIDKFDFSCVKGNIVHKTYDCEIDNVLDAKISQKIIDFGPYEELVPDYTVEVISNESKEDQQAAQLIKTSKFEYIKKYVNDIDNRIIEQNKIDKNKLIDLLKEHYCLAVEK